MTISCPNDLKKYGINPLTGEACAYSLRVLYDLSAAGLEIIERFFGGTVEVRKGSNWNPKVGDDPAVGSVMLSHHIIEPLAVFIAFYVEGSIAVIIRNGEVTGLDEKQLKIYAHLAESDPDFAAQYNVRHNWAHNPEAGVVSGDRNVHQASGRVS